MSGRLRRRALGTTLGLCVAAGLLWWRAADRPQVARFRLLPENEGAIAAVAFHFVPEAADTTTPALRAFLTALAAEVSAGPDPSHPVQVYAVCSDEPAAAALRHAWADWRLGTAARLQPIVLGTPITPWCKDRFLVGEADLPPGHLTLLSPAADEQGWGTRSNEAAVAPTLAGALGGRATAETVSLAYDAGDLLATRTHLFAGEPLYGRNQARWAHSRPELRQKLEGAFGLPVVWLGRRPGEVPDHHLGMYLAPVDGHTVLVGDAELGRQLWARQPRAARQRGDGPGPPDFAPERLAQLAAARDQLRRAGFQVGSLPLVPFRDPKVFLTYTNGLWETRGGRRVVYLPWYDRPVLDAAAEATCRRLGYEVHRIPVRRLYPFRGTIGCLVNVLQRDGP